jgi:hypothetical protein
VALAALGGYEWLQERAARLKAETQTAAQQKTIDQAKSDARAVGQQLAAQLKSLEAQRQQPATAQRIVAETSKLIPGLPQPITIQTSPQPAVGNGPAQPGAADLAKVPQQQIVIPAVDFAAIQNAEIDCQEDSAKLASCNRTAADTATELQATSAQRDEWKTAAKGGNWLHKTVTAAKWIVIGGAVGAVAGYAAHK